jgi:hypothetical protein
VQVALAAGSIYASTQAGKKARMPDLPEVAAPQAAQGAQMPDEVARRATKNTLTPAMAATMLTGAGGVSPGGLNLGKNQLLGQ